MPMYTGLARVARKTGYPVVERTGWKTRGHGKMGRVRSIICHHTASANTGNAPALSYVESNRGALPGPLAQYVLGRDGTIYVVAAGRCWHAGKVGKRVHSNTHAIGIEAENDGRGEKWGPAQYDAYVKLCAALVAEFKLPVSAVLGHKEVGIPRGRKIDPTFDMGAFRKYVARGHYLDDKPGTVKPAVSSKPTPIKPKPKPAKKKPKGSKKNRSIQTALKTMGLNVGVVDGVNGPMQKAAVRKFQDFHGLVVDGRWQKKTQAAFTLNKKVQKALKKQGYTKQGIDGYYGDQTAANVRDYQRRVGLVQDGMAGPITLKKLGIR